MTMKKGEKRILLGIGVVVVAVMAFKSWQMSGTEGRDKGIPFYSTASHEVASAASVLYRRYNCRDCHALWGVKSIMQAVPAPSLDGMGSIRDEEWLFRYFSAENPQSIIPSRLKAKYQMPSFASLPEDERRLLAKYIASLKVKDWYLEQTKKTEYEKLTGKDYSK